MQNLEYKSMNYWTHRKGAHTTPKFFFSDMTKGGFYILTLIVLLSVHLKPVHGEIHTFEVNIQKSPTGSTPNKFLSVAIGGILIAQNFKNFDMKTPRLQKLLSALSPGYFRIGGTLANKLWFDRKPFSEFRILEDETGEECFYEGRNCRAIQDEFVMTEEQWLDVNKFASKAGFKILFDINVLKRYQDGSWDSRNAEKLIKFSSDHKLDVIWELGNEPTLYKNLHKLEVGADQLAIDFIKLRSILNEYPIYKDSLLVGPDMAQPRPNNVKFFKYLTEFLEGGGTVIDAVTWHQYNLNGNIARSGDFLNPEAYDELKRQIKKIRETVTAAGFPKKPIWLGETASAYGGGAPCISDRFIASFLWLDKLGVAAQYDVDLVVRQTFFRGHYALVEDDLTPLPDWWVSLLYKRLVGNKVLSCNSESSEFVRLYAHCTKKHALETNDTSITVFGVNLKNNEVKVQLRGIPSLPEKVYAFILTAPDADLMSKSVLLNNDVPTILLSGDVPRLKAKLVKTNSPLKMPPFSLAFWVIPTPSFHFC